MNNIVSNYDKFPVIEIELNEAVALEGWDVICQAIQQQVDDVSKAQKVVVLETYQGVMEDEIVNHLKANLKGTFYFTKDYFLSEDKINTLVYPDVTDDEIFGYITRLQMIDFFDADKLKAIKQSLKEKTPETVFIFGPGASLFTDNPFLLVYFDMPRWEIQLRFRKNLIGNLGLNNHRQKASLQYKQAFFVDWRVCDKHKKTLMAKWNFVVDTTAPEQPKMVSGEAYNYALKHAVTRPFRLVPFLILVPGVGNG
ncbi:MAG: hypothetical protein QM726_23445 [Chitinophagaceae bacterium]